MKKQWIVFVALKVAEIGGPIGALYALGVAHNRYLYDLPLMIGTHGENVFYAGFHVLVFIMACIAALMILFIFLCANWVLAEKILRRQKNCCRVKEET